MLRKTVANDKKRLKDPIKWRGHEVTRVEAFSDAVLAFAVTLLIVALEVPETYEDLMASMQMFFPFAICFLILFVIWNTQNVFFRRYGLRDSYTVALNGILLFLTLFFVYPLKFLMAAWFGLNHVKIVTLGQFRTLFLIYGSGFASIYFVFALMYHNASRKRVFLNLTPEELFATRTRMFIYLCVASGGVAAIIMAAMPYPICVLASTGFFVIWPSSAIVRAKRNKRYRLLFGSNMEKDMENAEIKDELKAIDETLS